MYQYSTVLLQFFFSFSLFFFFVVNVGSPAQNLSIFIMQVVTTLTSTAFISQSSIIELCWCWPVQLTILKAGKLCLSKVSSTDKNNLHTNHPLKHLLQQNTNMLPSMHSINYHCLSLSLPRYHWNDHFVDFCGNAWISSSPFSSSLSCVWISSAKQKPGHTGDRIVKMLHIIW